MQDDVIRVMMAVETEFYLTGGTALSRGYLHHRYSDDLDFFVNDDDRFALWVDRVIQMLNLSSEWGVDVGLRQPRLARVTVVRGGVSLKLEFINDVPARVGAVVAHPVLGRLDTAENILANKLTAVVVREEPKDLADIWGLCTRLGLSLSVALEDASGKAAGLFPADVARVLLSATRADWEIIRWADAPDVEQFVREVHALGESLLFPPEMAEPGKR